MFRKLNWDLIGLVVANPLRGTTKGFERNIQLTIKKAFYQGTAPKVWQLMAKTDARICMIVRADSPVYSHYKNKKLFHTQNTQKENKDIDRTNLPFSLCPNI